MSEVTVKFIKLHPNALPFKYIRNGDACMDIYCLNDEWFKPGETKIIKTGIAVEIPEGYEGIIRGRSGLASKGIFVHVGTVEASYRGDVGVIMYSATSIQHFAPHSRIAQFTIKPVITINLQEAEQLTATERGVNGYGSSGI